MAITLEEVKRRFPIHWLVWNNQHEDLKNSLEANQYTSEDIELKDPRGRTPLLLAVTLGRVEAARLLLDAGADVNCEKDGWTAVQEATATGSQELLSLVLGRRDARRHAARAGGVPDLLRRLSLAPDFYVEMKWEFTSWVPLVSRMCPFDTYKVYKRGGNVRVDTTLVGFENNRWQRGDRTYIFRGQGTSARLVELDHELRTAWEERVGPPATPSTPGAPGPPDAPAPPPRAVQQRLAAPLAINYLDTDKISFERNKSGIWGWRQDKTESVNGYECKVFSANNVELVSSTRSEHLPRGDAARRAAPRAPLAGLLALADRDEPARSSPATPLLTPDQEQEEPLGSGGGGGGGRPLEEAAPVSWEEYFSEAAPPRDIGRPRELTTKVQKFKATLWLCEDYPLELQEQIMPILDLMAAMSSPHFVKLKDFIQMQLPAGFPVKIEIPLFHVLNARITFGNIFATETAVPFVECVPEGERLACLVDDACFEVGRGYRDAAHARPPPPDGEEGLLQYAIEQSLMEAGTHRDQVDVWEALRGARPASPAPPPSPGSPAGAAPPAPLPRDLLAHEERQLQRAIEASLALSLPGARAGAGGGRPGAGADEPEGAGAGADEDELAAALAASAREAAARASQLEEEQRALDEVLRLSLVDK